jgi:nicotinamide-nucleotide amidase
MEYFSDRLHQIIGDKIFGYENDTLEHVIVSLLKQKNATLSFAESCTGGYLAHKLTSVPGSSAVFNGSVVAYSYDIKSSQLGVSAQDLAEHGAVSEVVVRQMAEGVKKMMKSDYAIAASGIAGPDGGVEGKPVGTVWIAIAHPDGIFVKKYLFGNDRLRNIEQTFLYAFEALRLILLEKDPYKKYA